MKRYFLSFFFLISLYNLKAQVQGVAIGADAPKENAILYLRGNGSQGLILPIVTSRNFVAEDGMLVFDNSDKKLWYFSNNSWVEIGGGGGGGSQTLSIEGNELVLSGGNSVDIAVNAPDDEGGQILMWNGSAWTSSGAVPPQVGHVLKWNGTTWVAQADDTGTGTVPTLSNGNIFIGDGSNNIQLPLSGDATLNAATLTISPNAINSGKIEDGTITSADITDGTITGADIASSTIATSQLAPSSAAEGQVLKFVGGTWVPSADDVGSGSLPTLTQNQIVTNNGSSNIGITLGGDISLDASQPTNNTLINDGVVTSTKIADGTITGADLNEAIDINTTGILNASGSEVTLDPTTLSLKGATWPGANGTGVLTNDGTGTLTWSPSSGGFTNPMTTTGDIIFRNSAGNADRLGGSAGFLKSTGAAAPAWSAVNLASTDVTGTLPLANGGTGATTAAAARTNLGLGTLSTLSAVGSTEITDASVTGADLATNIAITTSGSFSTSGNFTASGTTVTLKGATWPAANAAGVLTNNGTGTLTWNAAAGSLDGLTDVTVSTPADAQILIKNGAGDFTNRSVSGDVLLNSTGGTTIQANAAAGGRIINSINSAASETINTARLNGAVVLDSESPAAGDISGSYTAGLQIGSAAVGTTEIADLSITNADVNASAAIAGTKIAPAFGNQTITTTGTGGLSVAGTTTLTSLAGTGTRMVVANPTGVLGFQTLPSTFSISNVIPKGDGTTLVGSSIYEESGQVAIGHTNPDNILDVRSSGVDAPALLTVGNSDASHRLWLYGGRQSDPLPFLMWKNGDPLRLATDASGFTELFRFSGTGTPSTDGLEFHMGSTDARIMNREGGLLILGSSSNEVLHVTSGGNVGINNNSPSSMLDVGGAIEFNGALLPNNLPGTAGQVLTSSGPGVAPTWEDAGGGRWGLSGNSGTVATTNFIGTTDNIALSFRVNDEPAGRISPSGSVFLGHFAGEVNTATNNTGVGYQALRANTSGTTNTAMGISTLRNNTTGAGNSAFGNESLFNNTTGNQNVGVGSQPLVANTSGSNNVGVGTQPLAQNTTGNFNVAIGQRAMFTNVAGSNAVAIGANAMYNVNNTSTAFDNNNVAIGYQALMGSGTPANNTGTSNTSVGYQALSSNTSGSGNTAHGNQTLISNTTGSGNTGIGNRAMTDNTIGNNNSAFGGSALSQNTTGNQNSATGYEALYLNSTGVANTATGYQALSANIGGNNNTAFGHQSLLANTTGSGNTALGWHADVTSPNLTNATAIGYNAKVALSNALVLGGTGGDAVNVGIGTTSPNAPLQFGNTLNNRKIVFNETVNNDHQFFGIGVNTNTMRFQVPAYGVDSYLFYGGVNATTSAEIMRIEGDYMSFGGRSTPLAASVFDIDSDVGAGLTGMHIHSNDPDGQPFYGYANDGNIRIRTYMDGTTGSWRVQTGGSVDLLTVTQSGRVGIGTTTPASPLNVIGTNAGSGPANSGTVSTAALRVETDGSNTVMDIGVADDADNGGWIQAHLDNDQSSNSPLLFNPNGGNVGIGTLTPLRRLTVEDTNTAFGYAMSVRKMGTGAQGLIEFLDAAGTNQGGITINGTTVTYTAFTGSHRIALKENSSLSPGTLLMLTGNVARHGGPTSEPTYEAKPTSVANDPRVIGSYFGVESARENGHLAMAVGNGEIWVTDNGENLVQGDYLISSDVEGHAMKDNAQFEISYIVGRVAEPVDWSTVTESIDGKKHKLVSVFFESFVRNNKAEKLEKELSSIRQDLDQVIKEMEKLKTILNAEAKKK